MLSGLKNTLQILGFLKKKQNKKKKPQNPNTAVQRNKITITPRTLDSFFLALLPVWLEIRNLSPYSDGQTLGSRQQFAPSMQAQQGGCASACLWRNFADFRKGQKVLSYSKWVCPLLTVGSFAALLKGKWGSLSGSESVACGWAKAWSSLCPWEMRKFWDYSSPNRWMIKEGKGRLVCRNVDGAMNVI